MKAALQIDLSFEQILSMVRQLSPQQKLKLSKELEKEIIDSKLSRLLKTFKTNELDLGTITEEVESVRQEIYDRQKHQSNL
jgi:predicted DNA-binding protein YlxM (UPF0122 family)